jgi:2-polyprenyl-6-methoxyphenol hydroxylase-like FAD-dependent oxidoreductase
MCAQAASSNPACLENAETAPRAAERYRGWLSIETSSGARGSAVGVVLLGLWCIGEATGVATREFVYANRFGQTIWSEPRGLDAGYTWPQVSIHRGRLHLLLLEAARERLGAARIHLGARLADFAEDPTGIIARFEDGRTARADVLVAADGIHSTARSRFHPDEGPPKWNGAILWRATSIAAPFLTGATMAQIGTRDEKFVVYPIADLPDGRKLTNWIAERRVDPNHAWKREDWNRPGRLEDFFPSFADWRFDWLDVPALIRDADRVIEYPMVDRDPADRWTYGRVTLLGDAAHPMYPRGSNGSAQALIDARVLAEQLALAGSDDPRGALEAYEAQRRPATARIVETNRSVPPDYILMKVDELTGGRPFERLSDVISEDALRRISDDYKRIAGFSVESLKAPGG